MRFLSVAYMEQRFPAHMPKQGGAYNVFAPSNGNFGSGTVHRPSSTTDSSRIETAIDSVETWFVRQIPIFGRATPSLLPLDLKEALADIVFAKLFNIEGKTKDDMQRSIQARDLILAVAPSYDGATVEGGQIVLSEDAPLVGLAFGWDS